MNLEIVLVGPEPARADDMSRQLAGHGVRVLGCAGDGSEAERMCARHRPDVLLMDIRLPGPDGLEAAARITARHPLPMVLITAHADPAFLKLAKAAGAFGYLLKPVEPGLLAQSLALAARAFEREQGLRRSVRDLRRELEAHKAISRARGILMEQAGISLDQAAERIRAQAERSGMDQAEVAQGIIATRDISRRDG